MTGHRFVLEGRGRWTCAGCGVERGKDACPSPAQSRRHTHACILCADVEECEQDCPAWLRLGVWSGEHRHCARCKAGLDEIDSTPAPRRPALTIEQLVESVIFVTTQAVEASRGRVPERAREIFERGIAELGPVDPTADTIDTWARLGAVAGAMDTWLGTTRTHGRETASPAQKMAYTGAFTIAAWCVSVTIGARQT